MKRRTILLTSLVVFGLLPIRLAHATTVCFDLLAGRKCVEFRTPPPEAPVSSRGMSMTLTTDKIISGDSLTATARKFAPGEYVRAFVFNVYGRAAATELSGGAVANKKGVAVVNYGTTSLPVSVSEVRTICLRGERSKLMACASFAFEG